ncbi:hypothetical protein FH972_000325 [Carpinus fangiana]|uniref:DUF4220 domain-containing protein n=1 Tax=Carpinus fangiana TaxID=176857 RepID=A0A5N6QAV7_9ROSI|nr:hypothetical protein FH972_000325 [Carpinus fangiana]
MWVRKTRGEYVNMHAGLIEKISGSVLDILLAGVKRLWSAWNLRGCILLSLFLQVCLLFLAPLRKRGRRKLLHGGVWVAYLLCDWVAAVAIGLISKGKGDATVKRLKDGGEGFMAFWASFLLMHLGGPDTITSFALEDNQFWLRHLTGLVVQLVSTVYIFYQTFPKTAELWIPTLTVFVAGTIKYAERTRALYLASLGQFGHSVLPKPNPGPDYEEAVTIYSSLHLIHVPPSRAEAMPTPEDTQPPLDQKSKCRRCQNKLESDIHLLQEAHRFFKSFKGLIVGYLLSSKDRELSRQYFLTKNAKEAFRLISYELNFMYDLLHTKVVVVRTQIGYIFRFISFSSILVALMVFRSIEKEYGFDKKLDIKLSYALLMGALGFEAVNVVMLIFSDWTLVTMKIAGWSKFIAYIILKRRRWSWSISQYDMISYCLKGLPEWCSSLATLVRLEGVLDKCNISLFSHSDKVSKGMEEFIFEQLKMKSLTVNSLKAGMDACSQRGEWALMQTSGSFELKWSIEEYQYAESLLLWHLATELLYQTQQPEQKEKTSKSCFPWPKRKEKKPESPPPEKQENTPQSCCPKIKEKIPKSCRCWPKNKEKGAASSSHDYKEICKNLSDYMFYLLVMQTAVMAPVLGNWQIAFEDTRAEAKRFFSQKGIKKLQPREACETVLCGAAKKFFCRKKIKRWQERRRDACSEVFKVDSKFRPVAVKGSKSKSVLFDACILAKQLKNLDVDKWMVISRVWVELMSYAAIKCIPIVHAQQPSRGGELLTFVWLLMNHLGLGTQSYEHERQTRTKMVDLNKNKGGQTETNKEGKQENKAGKPEKQNNAAGRGCTSRLTEFSKFKKCCK